MESCGETFSYRRYDPTDRSTTGRWQVHPEQDGTTGSTRLGNHQAHLASEVKQHIVWISDLYRLSAVDLNKKSESCWI